MITGIIAEKLAMENITVSLYKSPINFIIVSAIENKKKATVPSM